MFEIKTDKLIAAPQENIWESLIKTDEYNKWNEFITGKKHGDITYEAFNAMNNNLAHKFRN